MVENKPYTYLIGWSKYDKWYYGVRYSKKCNPKDLWETYFTSSNQVKTYREHYGEPDVVQVRKIFDNIEKAQKWEYKVLKRLNVTNEEKWLNKTDNKCISEKCAFRSSGYIWINNSDKEKYIEKESLIPDGWNVGRLYKKKNKSKYIVSDKTRLKISLANKNKNKPEGFGEKVRSFHLGRKRSIETRKNISQSKKGKSFRAKTWIFDFNGKQIEIHNLAKYCRENDLNISCMKDLYYGRQKQHKKYKRNV